jgi:hypothetical protein
MLVYALGIAALRAFEAGDCRAPRLATRCSWLALIPAPRRLSACAARRSPEIGLVTAPASSVMPPMVERRTVPTCPRSAARREGSGLPGAGTPLRSKLSQALPAWNYTAHQCRMRA